MSDVPMGKQITEPAPFAPIRKAGVLLLLTAAATVVMVALRVAGDTDQATLIESLRAIAEDRVVYGAGGAARLVSGVTLLAAAWTLSRMGFSLGGLDPSFLWYMFGASGIVTAVSGACTVLLAAYHLPDASVAIPAWVEATATLRWMTGKAGFAAAGVALVVGAVYQWRVGGNLRKAVVASAVIGLAMQFIWIDAATIIHRITGPAFFIWLVATGVMLTTWRVERQVDDP